MDVFENLAVMLELLVGYGAGQRVVLGCLPHVEIFDILVQVSLLTGKSTDHDTSDGAGRDD